jgi:hypothetical protein
MRPGQAGLTGFSMIYRIDPVNHGKSHQSCLFPEESFMREICLTVLLLLAVTTETHPYAEAQDASGKANQLLGQARTSIGDEKLNSLRSLSATGSYRRILGEREMSGEIQFDLILPDKMMRTETMSPAPGAEITRIEAINGDSAWSDQQSSGMGGGMIVMRRPGGDSPQGQATQTNAIRAELARIAIGWLLSSPSSFPLAFSYAGEAEAPDGKADALDVKGPNGFSARLFLDRETHRPLMLAYKGKKPRIMMRTFTGPRSKEEMDKEVKAAEAVAANQPDVEYQIRFSEHRKVDGISLPHRLTRAIDGEINEEWEISKFKINPSLKAEKFEKR